MDPPNKKIRLFDSTFPADILDWKLKSFSDIIYLSCQSYGSLYSRVVDRVKLRLFEEKYENLLKSCHKNIVKIYIIFNSLTVEQQGVFLNIHENLNKDIPTFNVIDAGPGTGKTFLISMFILSYCEETLYMVYSKKLANIINLLQFNGESKTCCKVIMDMFNVKYFDSKHLWSCVNFTFNEKCYYIYNLVLKIPEDKRLEKLYILDEDSVVSPWHIYYLFCFAKVYNKHVLFIGDRYQQNSISKTSHHNECNYSLIKNINGITNLSLTERVRQQGDFEFQNILNSIGQIFKDHDRNTEVKMTFDIKFKIFLLLHSNFILTERFDTMFFSQYHVILKARLIRHENYLKKNNIKYTKAPFMIRENTKLKEYIAKKPNNKYIDYLLLVIGAEYIYTPSNVVQNLVKLLEVHENILVVQNYDTCEIIQIKRISLTASFIPEEQLTTLPNGLFQYPLKGLASTYHSAQGLTISTGAIELDLDCSTLNSFYVGITRIVTRKQLFKIHTNEIVNLLLTLQKNDEYYYRVSRLFHGTVEEIVFNETNALPLFTNSILYRNLKINKSKFEQKKVYIDDTNLIKIIKTLSDTAIEKYAIILKDIKIA